MSILEEVVDEAVNNFVIEKEYLEFISLLLQPIKLIPSMHKINNVIILFIKIPPFSFESILIIF